jgi:hypothetical protein
MVSSRIASALVVLAMISGGNAMTRTKRTVAAVVLPPEIQDLEQAVAARHAQREQLKADVIQRRGQRVVALKNSNEWNLVVIAMMPMFSSRELASFIIYVNTMWEKWDLAREASRPVNRSLEESVRNGLTPTSQNGVGYQDWITIVAKCAEQNANSLRQTVVRAAQRSTWSMSDRQRARVEYLLSDGILWRQYLEDLCRIGRRRAALVERWDEMGSLIEVVGAVTEITPPYKDLSTEIRYGTVQAVMGYMLDENEDDAAFAYMLSELRQYAEYAERLCVLCA